MPKEERVEVRVERGGSTAGFRFFCMHEHAFACVGPAREREQVDETQGGTSAGLARPAIEVLGAPVS